MRIRRRLPIILAVLLVAAAVALAVVLRKHAPPEPARLLPAADGFVYVDLQWMRRANVTGELPAVPHDPDYEQFIQATGFQFERDLDEAAVAIHYPAKSPGGSPDSAQQPRFSEVFVGKIDGERLRNYLGRISSSVENYQTRDIFNIPLQGRTVRVAILGVDTVAASNLDDPLVIRGIIARSRKLASPFGGPAASAPVLQGGSFCQPRLGRLQNSTFGRSRCLRPHRMVLSLLETRDRRGLGALSRGRPFQGSSVCRKRRRSRPVSRTDRHIPQYFSHCRKLGLHSRARSRHQSLPRQPENSTRKRPSRADRGCSAGLDPQSPRRSSHIRNPRTPTPRTVCPQKEEVTNEARAPTLSHPIFLCVPSCPLWLTNCKTPKPQRTRRFTKDVRRAIHLPLISQHKCPSQVE